MQVTTKTKTITTKTHVAAFSADELKAVALSTVKGAVGAAEIMSHNVKIGDDGSITVEIVEQLTVEDADVPAATSADVPLVQAEAAAASGPVAEPAPAVAAPPAFHFGKAA